MTLSIIAPLNDMLNHEIINKMDYKDLLTQECFGNTIEEYLQALAIFLVLLIVFRIFRVVVLARAKTLASRTSTDLDDKLVSVLESIKPYFYDFIALYVAVRKLFLPKIFLDLLNGLFLAVMVIQTIIALQKIIEYFLGRLLKHDTSDQANQMFNGLKLFIKLILWTTGFLLFLSNTGINITSLAASLGIGGIAVALAVQNILGDIFSSFSIYFDKPFVAGDFIVIGDHKGTVKKIGLKTTRIESVDGEEIIVSNKELTSSRIQNFKRMQKRRSLFVLKVDYATTNDQCKLIPQIITKIFDEVENADLDHVNFLEFGVYSLNFEVVYFHLSGDYNEYANVREQINLRIKEEFENAGIEFAIPTQRNIDK